MNLLKISMLALMLAFVSVAANAGIGKPGEAVVHGYVVDAITKKPLSGVLIVAMALKTQQNKEVSTDSLGYFRFNDMSVDEVSFEFEKKGYKIVRKEKLNVRENMIFKLSVEMQVGKDDLEEENDFYEHPLLRIVDAH